MSDAIQEKQALPFTLLALLAVLVIGLITVAVKLLSL